MKTQILPLPSVRAIFSLPKLHGALPVDGMSGLAAGVIADLNVALIELHCNVIIIAIVQQDAIIFSCRHLERESKRESERSIISTKSKTCYVSSITTVWVPEV